MTTKGQVTIPKTVRDMLGIGPGSLVRFDLAEDGHVRLLKAHGPSTPDRFARLVGSAGPGLSTDAIMALTRGEELA
jgi:AbrB family looped-hinge helix DNA binding protein